MLFHRQARKKKTFFRSLPSLELLEARLVPAGEFSLHSLPGASKVIYLDFDGHTTTNTMWNTQNGGANGATIVSPAYDIDNNPSAFSNTELANIVKIWEQVTEDFRPFNVDITTEDPGLEALRNTGGSDNQWGLRVAIGGSWQTVLPAKGSAGGWSYVGTFGSEIYGPAFVFPGSLGNGFPEYVASAASHEAGHSLGLSHDGDATQGYYPGHGTGTTSWGPIMGAPFDISLTQWSKGEYSGANNREDDLAIITNNTNGFGYRNDDYGSSIANASNLVIQNSTTINTTGIIERNTDLDFFRFNLAVGGTVNININPALVGPNLDIEAKLYDSGGTLIATSNPTGALNATFTRQLQSGSYYISVDGVGEGSVSGTGYSDYGSLGYYAITGTIPNSVSPPVITGPNGGPGAANSTTSIPENTTSVYTFTSDKVVTWSLVSGSDLSRFSINASTGALSFVTAPDFENPTDSDRNNTYIVTLRALDSAGLSSTQTITVTVTDVLEVPPRITGPSGTIGAPTSTTAINENTTSVYSFIADKPVTWSISGGLDQSKFFIDSITGALSFTTEPDFERPADSDKNNTYIVTVMATDAQGMFSTQTVTVTVRDVTENPPNNGTFRPDIYGAKVIHTNAIGLANGTITGFRVIFNEAINPSSFTNSDIIFTTPTGTTVSVTNPVLVANTNNTEFTFNLSSSVNANGAYTLKVGPDVLDLAGNKMNQDGDGTNGEAVQDAFAGTYNISTSYTFNNSRVVTIRDVSTITSSITINQNINIKDLNVLINVSHTADSDLLITLKSPTGQVCVLSNRNGGLGDNFVNTIFDSDVATSLASGNAPFNGTFRPDGTLTVFNNKSAKGVWTLTIEDKAHGDIGKLNFWKLNIVSDTKLSSTTNLANSDGGTVTTVINAVSLAASLAPAGSPGGTSTNNPANPNVSPCGCPACRGLPTRNSPLIANGAVTAQTASASARPVVNHQSQADALFGANSGLVNLFRL